MRGSLWLGLGRVGVGVGGLAVGRVVGVVGFGWCDFLFFLIYVFVYVWGYMGWCLVLRFFMAVSFLYLNRYGKIFGLKK